MKLRTVEKALAVVDWCLRRQFPDDYDARCMYSAFGVAHLLNKAGIQSFVSGGEIRVFTSTQDGQGHGAQGFGASKTDEPSHYWVDCGDRLLDLGPSYLPYRSSSPIASMPIVAWNYTPGMPRFLSYNAQISFHPEVEFRMPTLHPIGCA